MRQSPLGDLPVELTELPCQRMPSLNFDQENLATRLRRGDQITVEISSTIHDSFLDHIPDRAPATRNHPRGAALRCGDR